MASDSDITPAVVAPTLQSNDPEGLVKSRQRVADHGEVFTPSWMVEDMLDLVKGESERIDSRFLEPACGSGNFLRSVLNRKLVTVQTRYGKSDFERRHQALFAMMCIYGIELLSDNVQECRENLLVIYADYLQVPTEDKWYRAAKTGQVRPCDPCSSAARRTRHSHTSHRGAKRNVFCFPAVAPKTCIRPIDPRLN